MLKFDYKKLFYSFAFDKSSRQSVSDGWVNDMIEDSRGYIWMVSSVQSPYQGFCRFDPDSRTFERFYIKNFIPGYKPISIYQESDHIFYIGTDKGIIEFSLINRTFKKLLFNGLASNNYVSDFHMDSGLNLWLATDAGLYERKRGSDSFHHFDLSLVEGADTVRPWRARFFESSRHGLWIFTNRGLFLYDYKNGSITRHGWNPRTGPVFPSQDIDAFYEDGDGIAWVGMWKGGLSRYNVDSGEIKNYSLHDGLPSAAVQSILGDDANDALWLGTFDGLSHLDKKAGSFSNYSMDDGIQGPQFALGCLKSSKAIFFFGGSKGFTMFDPKKIIKNMVLPVVLITDFKISNESVKAGAHSVLAQPLHETKQIILSYDQNDIAFEFVAIHFANPSQNHYAYMLQNYEEDWRYVGNPRAAIYPNLPPGNYTFRLKASNNNEVWNEQGVSIRVIIRPPWWRTSYAYYLVRWYTGTLQ